jgi:topoisomerase-4 subunit A
MIHNKPRGKEQPDNDEILIADFIAVKGIAAQGNMLTKSKIKQINLLEPLPYVEPQKADEPVNLPVNETNDKIDSERKVIEDNGEDPEMDDTGQARVFFF